MTTTTETTTNTTTAPINTDTNQAVTAPRGFFSSLIFIVVKTAQTIAGALEAADILVEASHKAANAVNAVAGSAEAQAIAFETSARTNIAIAQENSNIYSHLEGDQAEKLKELLETQAQYVTKPTLAKHIQENQTPESSPFK